MKAGYYVTYKLVTKKSFGSYGVKRGAVMSRGNIFCATREKLDAEIAWYIKTVDKFHGGCSKVVIERLFQIIDLGPY